MHPSESKIKESLYETYLDTYGTDPDFDEDEAKLFVSVAWNGLKDSYRLFDRSVIANEPTQHLHTVFHGRLFHAIAPRIKASIKGIMNIHGMSVHDTQNVIMMNYIAWLEQLLPKEIRDEIQKLEK